MKYGDRLAKILADRPSSELNELQRDLNKLWDDQQIVSGWLQTGQSRIAADAIDFPVKLLYSETLAVDTGTIDVDLPQTYNHLMIFGAGRTTEAGSVVKGLLIRLNGDDGPNYTTEIVTGANSTAAAVIYSGSAFAAIGSLAGADAAAGLPGVIFAMLPSYTGQYFKQVMALTRVKSGATEIVGLGGAVWGSTVPVQSIQIFSEAGSIATGSNLSVFGMK